MLNRITLMGRLTTDPDVRAVKGDMNVATFTLACDRDGKDKDTDFISCVAWRNTADFVSKYFSKGQAAVVDGRLQTRSYTDKDGKNRKTFDVVVNSIYFADSKRKDAGTPAYSQGREQSREFEEVDDDGDLPF